MQALILTSLIATLFLLHLRSALVVVVTLPVAVLFSFLVMRLLGVQAKLMSLAGIAIAIGAMADAAVVLIDNMHKHLEQEDGEPDPAPLEMFENPVNLRPQSEWRPGLDLDGLVPEADAPPAHSVSQTDSIRIPS